MSSVDLILQQALALPADDRAYVVHALEQSLTGPPDDGASSELLAELQRRSSAYRSGQTTARPAQEVLADLRERQARESAS